MFQLHTFSKGKWMTTAAVWNWNRHDNRGEKARVRSRSLIVGVGFACNTDPGVYFMTVDSFTTAKRRKTILLKYLCHTKHRELKNSLSVVIPRHWSRMNWSTSQSLKSSGCRTPFCFSSVSDVKRDSLLLKNISKGFIGDICTLVLIFNNHASVFFIQDYLHAP